MLRMRTPLLMCGFPIAFWGTAAANWMVGVGNRYRAHTTGMVSTLVSIPVTQVHRTNMRQGTAKLPV